MSNTNKLGKIFTQLEDIKKFKNKITDEKISGISINDDLSRAYYLKRIISLIEDYSFRMMTTKIELETLVPNINPADLTPQQKTFLKNITSLSKKLLKSKEELKELRNKLSEIKKKLSKENKEKLNKGENNKNKGENNKNKGENNKNKEENNKHKYI